MLIPSHPYSTSNFHASSLRRVLPHRHHPRHLSHPRCSKRSVLSRPPNPALWTPPQASVPRAPVELSQQLRRSRPRLASNQYPNPLQNSNPEEFLLPKPIRKYLNLRENDGGRARYPGKQNLHLWLRTLTVQSGVIQNVRCGVDFTDGTETGWTPVCGESAAFAEEKEDG